MLSQDNQNRLPGGKPAGQGAPRKSNNAEQEPDNKPLKMGEIVRYKLDNGEVVEFIAGSRQENQRKSNH